MYVYIYKIYIYIFIHPVMILNTSWHHGILDVIELHGSGGSLDLLETSRSSTRRATICLLKSIGCYPCFVYIVVSGNPVLGLLGASISEQSGHSFYPDDLIRIKTYTYFGVTSSFPLGKRNWDSANMGIFCLISAEFHWGFINLSSRTWHRYRKTMENPLFVGHFPRG